MKTKFMILFILAFSFCFTISQGILWAQGLITLPQTGQMHCYDSTGNTIACAGTGQDGEIRAGLEWPKPRFTNPDGTTPITGEMILDRLTGLIWMRNAGTPTIGSCSGGEKSWFGAINYVECLNSINYLGYNDWRLPNINELESLLNSDESRLENWLSGQGFINVATYYWSSTSVANNPGTYAWRINANGDIFSSVKTASYQTKALVVRSGQ